MTANGDDVSAGVTVEQQYSTGLTRPNIERALPIKAANLAANLRENRTGLVQAVLVAR